MRPYLDGPVRSASGATAGVRLTIFHRLIFDYDNDGDLDLLIARLGSGGERVYNNDGNGNFTQVSGVVQVVNDSSLDIMVADLNGNGKFDIVTAQGESGSFVNRIYINTGPADTFEPLFSSSNSATRPRPIFQGPVPRSSATS